MKASNQAWLWFNPAQFKREPGCTSWRTLLHCAFSLHTRNLLWDMLVFTPRQEVLHVISLRRANHRERTRYAAQTKP